MEFGADSWWIFTAAASMAVGIITYFLKRTMSKQDEHEKDISHIKVTYVTKNELRELKEETSSGINKLQRDVEEIKDNTLTKADFFRLQANTDKKLDKMYDLILELRGGSKNA